jgi:hypothetical protein
MNEAYSVLCRSLASAHMEIDRLQVFKLVSKS